MTATTLSDLFDSLFASAIPKAEDIDVETKEEWECEIKECGWLYAQETDFFIKATGDTPSHGEKHVFARTLEGDWFSMGFLSSSSLGEKIE